MQATIAALLSAAISEYAPIESNAIKFAIASFCSRVIELPIFSKKGFLQAVEKVLLRKSKHKVALQIMDEFTLIALTQYLDRVVTEQALEKQEQNNYKWRCKSNKKEMQTIGDVKKVTFAFTDIYIECLHDNEDDSEDSKHKKFKKNITLFTFDGTPFVLQQFVLHIKKQVGNYILIHRSSEKEIQTFKSEDEDGEKSKSYQNNGNTQSFRMSGKAHALDTSRFEGIFFSKLEEYFMELHGIHAANITYKDADLCFRLTPHSFRGRLLFDTFKHETVSISFLFGDHARNVNAEDILNKKSCFIYEKAKVSAESIQISSQTLSMNDLVEYAKNIFQTMVEREASQMLKKYVRVFQCTNRFTSKTTWESSTSLTMKSLQNTVVSDYVQKELLDDVHFFLNNVKYYADRGLPWKRGYLLYGPPGTGKTSLIKAIAKEYGLPVFMIHLSSLTGEAFVTLMNKIHEITVGRPHIIAFEDVDRCEKLFGKLAKKQPYSHRHPYLHTSRYDDDDDDDNDDSNEKPKKKQYKAITWPELLNAMDGVMEWFGCLMFFSANNVSNFLKENPNDNIRALMRPGRVDKKIEIGFCDTTQLKKLFHIYFPLSEHPDKKEVDIKKIRQFENMSPAMFGELLLNHNGNYDQAENMLYGIIPYDEKDAKQFAKKEMEGEGKEIDDLEETKSVKVRQPRKYVRKNPKNNLKTPSTQELKKKTRQLENKLKTVENYVTRADQAALQYMNFTQKWLQRLAAQSTISVEEFEQRFTHGVVPAFKECLRKKQAIEVESNEAIGIELNE